MITLQYQANINDLARASLLFIEKKILLKTAIVFFNILTILMISLIALKLSLMGITLQEAGLASFCLGWLVARKPLTLWLLARKLKRDPAQKHLIEITLSKNGIVWSGQGLKSGQLAWKHIPYVIETQKGYILPSASTRFLWLPLSCFKTASELNEFKNLLIETNSKLSLANIK